eukprot:23741-Rhodomonas_salina.1
MPRAPQMLQPCLLRKLISAGAARAGLRWSTAVSSCMPRCCISQVSLAWLSRAAPHALAAASVTRGWVLPTPVSRL